MLQNEVDNLLQNEGVIIRKHGRFYKVGQFYHKVGKVFSNRGNQNKAEQYICHINIP